MASTTAATKVTKVNDALLKKVIFDFIYAFRDRNLIFIFAKDVFDRSHWYTQTPNYFFPKMEHYPGMDVATIVFFASTMGLLFLVFLLVLILYRMGRHVREQRVLQSQLRTISEILGLHWKVIFCWRFN